MKRRNAPCFEGEIRTNDPSARSYAQW